MGIEIIGEGRYVACAGERKSDLLMRWGGMAHRRDGLWRHANFLRLWIGQTISQFGSQITFLALPLAAALTLHATPGEMGVLTAAETAPFLLVGLFAGVWVDRLPRRLILLVADFGRGVLLLAIPVAALAGVLTIALLYAVAFVVGILTVFFDVAYQSFLPALVGREHLVDGNSKLETTRSAAQIAGPGLAGTLVQLITAPAAVIVDALSFFVSAGFLVSLRVPTDRLPPRAVRRTIWSEIGEGLRIVVGNPLLRAIAGCTGTANFFGGVAAAVLVLYITRDLGLRPGAIGLVFAMGSVGLLVGALLARRIAGRIGVGATIIAANVLSTAGALLAPLAHGAVAVTIPLLVGAQFFTGMGGTIYNITQVSLRQTITPDHLLGRMNATMRFIVWGVLPLGGLLGGLLGSLIGLRGTLLVGAVGEIFAVFWVLFSPVRKLREQPTGPVGEPQPAVRTAIEPRAAEAAGEVS
jgi:MFS family permease